MEQTVKVRALRALLLFVGAQFPSSLPGQPDSGATTHAGRRNNVWVSGGIGVGTGGFGAIGSVWYSYNHVVIGAHKTVASPIMGRDVHDTAWLIGVRNLAKGRIMLIAAGPARVGGLHHRGDNDPSTVVPANEAGIAVAAEALLPYGTRGIGTDLFAARSKNRSILGATVSFQLGWLN